MEKSPGRSSALDIIRTIAVSCVVAVHFFLNTGFYDDIVTGPSMLIAVMMRSSFMICVPLFLILTGYLVRNTTPNAKYYIRLVRVLFIYVISSLFCAVYKICVLKTGLSPMGAVINILTFETAPYAWYIEMYIGLFLLIPFLNILYNNLKTRQTKIYLLLTCAILTILPSIMNIYQIAGIEWWIRPSSYTDHFPLVPDWWKNLYPVTYFYLGCYLRDYPVKLRKSTHILLIVLTFMLAGAYNYYRSCGAAFIEGSWQDYASLLVTVQTVLVFSFFSGLPTDQLAPFWKNLFAKISSLSLGAYLTSWIFDQMVYTRLNQSISAMEEKLLFFPIAVPVVLICSLSLSQIISVLYAVSAKKLVDQYLHHDRIIRKEGEIV